MSKNVSVSGGCWLNLGLSLMDLGRLAALGLTEFKAGERLWFLCLIDLCAIFFQDIDICANLGSFCLYLLLCLAKWRSISRLNKLDWNMGSNWTDLITNYTCLWTYLYFRCQNNKWFFLVKLKFFNINYWFNILIQSNQMIIDEILKVNHDWSRFKLFIFIFIFDLFYF